MFSHPKVLLLVLGFQWASFARAQEPVDGIFKTEINGLKLGNMNTIGNLQVGQDRLFAAHLRADLRYPGNLLVAERSEIVTFNPSTGQISPIAGKRGMGGFQEGIGSDAIFAGITGFVQLGSFKIVTVSGGSNDCVRTINRRTNGTALLAGTCGQNGFRNGRLEESLFSRPQKIVRRGSLFYVSDEGNRVIRLINLFTRMVSTFFDFSGTGFVDAPRALAIQRGYLYVGGSTQLLKINLKRTSDFTLLAGLTGDSTLRLVDGPLNTATFRFITDLNFLSDDILLVADDGNRRLRIVNLRTSTVSSVCNGMMNPAMVDGPIDRCALQRPSTVAVRRMRNGFGVALSGLDTVRELSVTRKRKNPYYYY